MARDLHPSLSEGPAPKLVCIGCQHTSDHLVLAPVHGTTTMHICLFCATLTLMDVQAEIARSAAETAFEAIAPRVAA